MKINKIWISWFVLLCMQLGLFAQQTPQWMLPIYFETDDGQKDTVYIGWDPSASMDIDPQFYEIEKFVTPNLDVFNAYVDNSMGSGENYYDIRKGNIWQSLAGYHHINFIGTGSYPITMKWDYSLLFSENLPDLYPFIQDRPRARIDIYPEILGCFINCIDDCYYMCTDFLYPEFNSFLTWDCQGIIKDSVIFYVSSPMLVEEYQGLMLQIRPYNTIATWWNGAVTEASLLQEIQIMPNPITSFIQIANLPDEQLLIEVCDLLGRTVIINKPSHTHNNELTIDVEDLVPSTYILRITNANKSNVFIKKIIKL